MIKKKIKNELSPLSTGGSLHTTHTIFVKNDELVVKPSKTNWVVVIICILLGFTPLPLIVYMLFVVFDVLAALALTVGGITFLLIGIMAKNSARVYTFSKSKNKLIGFRKGILFKDIIQVEVLKKIVNAKTQDNPFQSGELRILTRDENRFLLIEGSDHDALSQMAREISIYTGANLKIDETLHRV